MKSCKSKTNKQNNTKKAKAKNTAKQHTWKILNSNNMMSTIKKQYKQ